MSGRRQQAFTPCEDCFVGLCTMNCSSAPLDRKIYVYDIDGDRVRALAEAVLK